MYELHHELPNDVNLRFLINKKNFRETSKLSVECSLVPSLPVINKNLATAPENWTKSTIKVCIKD